MISVSITVKAGHRYGKKTEIECMDVVLNRLKDYLEWGSTVVC